MCGFVIKERADVRPARIYKILIKSVTGCTISSAWAAADVYKEQVYKEFERLYQKSWPAS